MGVFELGRDLDFAGEPLRTHYRGQLGVENLQGHRAIVPQIAGEVDGCHAAPAELTLYLVPAGEGSAEAFQRIRHVG